ncbi:MAG: acetate kinase [Phycisphaerae bacterium]|nr:acetate kinase [Phycisphaerae bacterium]
MKILVINSGSSSIKYKLYDMARQTECATGLIERMGEAQSHITHQCNGVETRLTEPIPDADRGVARLIELLITVGDPAPLSSPDEVAGVGHRVVHGGEAFSESVIVDDKVLATIEECVSLAPLHNPANLAGLIAAMKILPGKPQAAVFDTAYFQTMPPCAYHYALPQEWYEKYRIRRYGFHGTSHRYVAMRAAELLDKPLPNLITLHLGNGCSMSCIRAGHAVDQTMGLTPLEGLVMGTRSGDIDPAIIFHLIRQGLSVEEVRTGLEKKSGLLGVSGVARDLRDVAEAAQAGNSRAALAIDVFAHRARKYVGAFLAELGACDAVVFTGGIGENAAFMREKIISNLSPLGIELDTSLNGHRNKEPFRISAAASRTAIWVIPTNEELMIARDTARLIS